jgi:hypothetical protein
MGEKQNKNNTENTDKKLKNGKHLFKPGFDPRRNYKGRPKGKRNWSKDFELAIKEISKQTGKSESEIRTALLAKGLQEAMRGESKFWTYIIDREYGKELQPIEGDVGIKGAQELASTLQDLLEKDNEIQDDKTTKESSQETGK